MLFWLESDATYVSKLIVCSRQNRGHSIIILTSPSFIFESIHISILYDNIMRQVSGYKNALQILRIGKDI